MSRDIHRREFLRLAALAPLGWAAGCGNSAAPPAERISDELAALRRAAAGPVPDLAARAPGLAKPDRPLFGASCWGDATGGPFSPATSKVHYHHHYLEYFRRWCEGERTLLRHASAVAAGGDPPAPGHLRGLAAELRASANLVVLHEVYWAPVKRSWWPGEKEYPELTALLQALHARWGGDWIIATQSGALAPHADTDTVPDGSRVIAAIDCAFHAWGLDHPDAESYLEFIANCIGETTAGKFLAGSLDADPGGETSPKDAHAAFTDLCHRWEVPDPAAAREGLRRLFPGAEVRLLTHLGSGAPTLEIAPDPGAPRGIWGHALAGVL
ncbi:MAG: hypothetical protein SF028_04870 [Candidatus Sumerlaeia bacterium]|nr:hypothetical protein [Candidatus Sumerlaeia bacterium]